MILLLPPPTSRMLLPPPPPPPPPHLRGACAQQISGYDGWADGGWTGLTSRIVVYVCITRACDEQALGGSGRLEPHFGLEGWLVGWEAGDVVLWLVTRMVFMKLRDACS
jgi:hypothetical protein